MTAKLEGLGHMNNNADNKPGVMIYFDIIPLIEEMNPENAGQLFLAKFRL